MHIHVVLYLNLFSIFEKENNKFNLQKFQVLRP